MFGLKDRSKERSNDLFRDLLDKEFRVDLEHIANVTSIPAEQRKTGQEFFLKMMMEKYTPAGNCPSQNFQRVSRNLQEEYLKVHKEICSLLYPAQDL